MPLTFRKATDNDCSGRHPRGLGAVLRRPEQHGHRRCGPYGGAAWVESGAVAAQHPIGGRNEGHDTVIASFAKVAETAVSGDIRLIDQRIDAGSDMAVETGTLVIAGDEVSIHHRVTNAYRKVHREWQLAHHHTDLSGSMLAILKRLGEAR